MLLPLLLAFILPTMASAVVVSRVTDFIPNTKAEADQVDAEFDNIISAINGNLNSENVLDGGISTADLATASVISAKIANATIVLDDIATNSGAYVYNRRVGCLFDSRQDGPFGANGIQIRTPCEVTIDGVRAALGATANVSTVGNMDTGSASFSTWHYVYIKANGGAPSFNISLTNPDLSSMRKPGDSTSRYLGAIRTGVGTTGVVYFKTFGKGNEYRLYDTAVVAPYPDSTAGKTSNLTTSASNKIADVPLTAEGVIFRAKSTGSGTGACSISLYGAELLDEVVYSTVTKYSIPFYQPVFSGFSGVSRVFTDTFFSSSNNCTSVDLISTGFVEPISVYQ